MLPFLAKKNDKANQTGLVIKTRSPDDKPDQDDPQAAIKACARDLINAIHAKDEQGVADALYDALDIMESQPSENNEESNSPHTYEDQA